MEVREGGSGWFRSMNGTPWIWAMPHAYEPLPSQLRRGAGSRPSMDYGRDPEGNVAELQRWSEAA